MKVANFKSHASMRLRMCAHTDDITRQDKVIRNRSQKEHSQSKLPGDNLIPHARKNTILNLPKYSELISHQLYIIQL